MNAVHIAALWGGGVSESGFEIESRPLKFGGTCPVSRPVLAFWLAYHLRGLQNLR
jgi:hypothetical protein